MGGCGDNVGVLERRVHNLGGDQTRDMGHVDHKVAANLVGDLAEALVVHLTAVGRGSGDDDLGPVHEGVLLELLIVDDAGLEVDAVGEGLEIGGHCGDPRRWSARWLWYAAAILDGLLGGGLVAVRQVTTVGQVETHDSVVRAHDGLVNLQVGRASTQALHVDSPLVFGKAESLQSTALAGKLDGIDVFVATVVTCARVSLGVLIAHGRSKSVKDSS